MKNGASEPTTTTKTHEGGARFVDRMFLGKCKVVQYDINAKANGKMCSGTGSGAESTWITQALPTL